MADRRPATYAAGAGGVLALVLDCRDLQVAADFWGAALGYRWRIRPRPDDHYLRLLPESGEGIELLLQRVPEAKTVKNRLHLDLRVRELEPEVERICLLGAKRLTEEPIRESGWAWHVLADPDGNELCVIRPPQGYWDAAP